MNTMLVVATKAIADVVERLMKDLGWGTEVVITPAIDWDNLDAFTNTFNASLDNLADINSFDAVFVSARRNYGDVLDLLNARFRRDWAYILLNFAGVPDYDAQYFLPFQRTRSAFITDLTHASLAQAIAELKLKPKIEPAPAEEAA